MTELQIKQKLLNEHLIWCEKKDEEISYFKAFNQQNLKDVLFWVWIILIFIGIGASSYLSSIDFALFTLFILLGGYHFHAKATKVLEEANIVYGITAQNVFKINGEQLSKYPIEQLIDIEVACLDNNKKDVDFIFQPQQADFTKKEIKGVVNFKSVALSDNIIEELLDKIKL